MSTVDVAALREGCHRYCRQNQEDACEPCATILALIERLEAAEGAVERVRALVDEWERRSDGFGGLHADSDREHTADLRAALDGAR